MAKVTIKGVRNTSVMAQDEVRTVERTVQVDRLIANGHVREVDPVPAEGPVPTVPDEGPEDFDVVVPPRSATKGEWVEFLQSQDIHSHEGMTKDDLIEAWDAHTDG